MSKKDSFNWNIKKYSTYFKSILAINGLILISITSCSMERNRPIMKINSYLRGYQNGHKKPSLSKNLLATLINREDRDIIHLIDIRNMKRIPMGALNTPNTEPISISLSANGERIALIRKRGITSQLILYQRKSGRIQEIELKQLGNPTKVSIGGKGKILAVEVTRQGKKEIDLIRLNN